jgi:hypothetical protein
MSKCKCPNCGCELSLEVVEEVVQTPVEPKQPKMITKEDLDMELHGYRGVVAINKVGADIRTDQSDSDVVRYMQFHNREVRTYKDMAERLSLVDEWERKGWLVIG